QVLLIRGGETAGGNTKGARVGAPLKGDRHRFSGTCSAAIDEDGDLRRLTTKTVGCVDALRQCPVFPGRAVPVLPEALGSDRIDEVAGTALAKHRTDTGDHRPHVPAGIASHV